MTKDEIDLIMKYRDLDPRGKAFVLESADVAKYLRTRTDDQRGAADQQREGNL